MTKQMFVCQETPAIPGKNSDAELAGYMVRLVLAHEDCTDQLETVQNHLEINGVQITDRLNASDPRRSRFFGIF